MSRASSSRSCAGRRSRSRKSSCGRPPACCESSTKPVDSIVVAHAYDVLPGAIGIVAGGTWRYANPALCALVGRELCGSPAPEVFAPGRYTTRWRCSDDRQVSVEITACALPDPHGALLLSIADLSAQEQLFARI